MLEDKLISQLKLFGKEKEADETNNPKSAEESTDRKLYYRLPGSRPYLLTEEGIRSYIKEFLLANDKDDEETFEELDKKNESQLLGMFHGMMKHYGIEAPFNCIVPGRTYVPFSTYRKKGRRKDLGSYVRDFHQANGFELPKNFRNMSANELTKVYFAMEDRYKIIRRQKVNISTEEGRKIDARVIVNLYR